jgi:hypothetical protein
LHAHTHTHEARTGSESVGGDHEVGGAAGQADAQLFVAAAQHHERKGPADVNLADVGHHKLVATHGAQRRAHVNLSATTHTHTHEGVVPRR